MAGAGLQGEGHGEFLQGIGHANRRVGIAFLQIQGFSRIYVSIRLGTAAGRKQNTSILPHLSSHWWKIKFVEQASDQPRHDNEYARASKLPEKRDCMIGFGALDGQGHIFAELEKVWLLFTQAQNFPSHVQLESAVLGSFKQSAC